VPGKPGLYGNLFRTKRETEIAFIPMQASGQVRLRGPMAWNAAVDQASHTRAAAAHACRTHCSSFWRAGERCSAKACRSCRRWLA